MKGLKLLTSKVTYPIALGVFILLRSILMVTCVFLIVLSLATGSSGWNAGSIFESISQAAGTKDPSPAAAATNDNNPSVTEVPTITPLPPTATAEVTAEVVETELPTATFTLEPSPTVEPTATQERAQVCPQAPGRVEDITYAARLSPSPLPAKIYLPPCYDVDGDSYPVLYLLAQEGYDENQWVDIGVAEIAEENIQSGDLAPFIIVMPQHPDRLFNGTDGGPGSYEAEVVEGLIPDIDARYRTIDSPEMRAIAGVSRGGVWAIEIAFSNPDIFGGLGAISPSLDSNYPRAQYDPGSLAAAAETLPPYILFLIAEDDTALPQVQALSQTLSNLGYVNIFLVEQPGQIGRLWPETVDELFNVLVSGW